MTTMAKDFKDLMALVDADFKAVAKSTYKRERLYFSIALDDRTTDVIARSMLNPRNNTSRITFLIKSPQDDSHYTLTYPLETDVIAILSTLDTVLFEHIRQFLVGLYRGEIRPTGQSVSFVRESLAPDVDSVTLQTDSGLWMIPNTKNDPEIATSFGYTISFRSFCDTLSLMLSMENPEKQKIVIAKYYAYAALLRSSTPPTGMPVPATLEHVRTVQDIEDIYSKMRFVASQDFDAKNFGIKQYRDYFQSAK